MVQKSQLTQQKKLSAANNQDGVSIYGEQNIGFEGPIPHPDILKGYKELDSSFPDRVFRIAENHAKQKILIR